MQAKERERKRKMKKNPRKGGRAAHKEIDETDLL
jgi:hypothetical protein